MSARPPWVQVECHFASFFSYRIPDFNSFYALASPVPSPSTVKLALVSALIEATGDVQRGERLFEHLREAEVAVAPPPLVGAFRVLVKRLKASRRGDGAQEAAATNRSGTRRFGETFGIREYLHCAGPVTFWIKPPGEAIDECCFAASRLRRLGTTDSLLMPLVSRVVQPQRTICARPLNELPLDPELLQGRLVIRLKDLTSKATLAHFAPGGGKGASGALQQAPYVLPLRVRKHGANWVLYERVEFPAVV